MNPLPNVLYSYVASPFAARVHVALRLKGIPFQVDYINPTKIKTLLPVGNQIPVLSVGNQHYRDSAWILSHIDELFADTPVLYPTENILKVKVDAAERWITEQLIPAGFWRVSNASAGQWNQLQTGWKLGEVMHKSCVGGLPLLLRILWPILLRKVEFIQHQASKIERGLTLQQVNHNMLAAFKLHLDKGPFIGGSTSPIIADASVYAQLMMPRLLGLANSDYWIHNQLVVQWVDRVANSMLDGPPLVPDVLTD